MSRTPRKEKTKSTGHGRGGFTSRITAMPSNVLVSPPKRHKMSKLKKKALKMSRQAGNKYVLVVRAPNTTWLDDSLEIAFSGDSPLSGLSKPLEMVRLYKDGREEVVRGGSFFGVDRRILRDIVMAGPQSAWVNMIDAPPEDFRANNQFCGIWHKLVCSSDSYLRDGAPWDRRRRKTSHYPSLIRPMFMTLQASMYGLA